MQGSQEPAIRLDGNVERGRPVRITVDGESIPAFEGESIAAALLAAGRRVFRHTHQTGEPRGLFCGMGVCYECLVTVHPIAPERVGERAGDPAVAGRERLRACVTPVQDGMSISTRDEWEGQPCAKSS